MPEIFVNTDYKKPSLASSLFSTFIDKPQDLHKLKFFNQHKEEKIVLILRAHWISNFGWIFLSLIFLVLPFFMLPFLDSLALIDLSFSYGMILSVIIFWYLFVFGFVVVNFLFWFYNVGIITNERVIDMDFTHLLYSEITETTLGKIEDLTDKRGGFLSVFFDYGNVFVQTAGTSANIEFLKVPKPSKVVPIISKLL